MYQRNEKWCSWQDLLTLVTEFGVTLRHNHFDFFVITRMVILHYLPIESDEVAEFVVLVYQVLEHVTSVFKAIMSVHSSPPIIPIGCIANALYELYRSLQSTYEIHPSNLHQLQRIDKSTYLVNQLNTNSNKVTTAATVTVNTLAVAAFTADQTVAQDIEGNSFENTAFKPAI